jgi:hypothetical protein
MPSGEHMTRRMEENDPTEEEIWGVPGGDPGLAFKVRMERPKYMDTPDGPELAFKVRMERPKYMDTPDGPELPSCRIRSMPAGVRNMQRDL